MSDEQYEEDCRPPTLQYLVEHSKPGDVIYCIGNNPPYLTKGASIEYPSAIPDWPPLTNDKVVHDDTIQIIIALQDTIWNLQAEVVRLTQELAAMKGSDQ